jgi:integrase
MFDFTSAPPAPQGKGQSHQPALPTSPNPRSDQIILTGTPVNQLELPLFAVKTLGQGDSSAFPGSHFGDVVGETSHTPPVEAPPPPPAAPKQRRKRDLSLRAEPVRLALASLTPPDPASMTAASIRETIETWTDLKPSQRRPLLTAVNHAADLLAANHHLLGDCAPWSCAGLNRVLWRSGEPAIGLKADPFRNMVTALRKILIRLGTHADSGYGRNKLSPAWEALHQALPTDEYRKGLLRFFRYLTLEEITPETITPDSINDFDHWCRTSILYADATGLSRRSAGNWEFARKNVPGWPQVKLHRQGMRDQYALPFDIFPANFNADVARFLRNPAPISDTPVKAGNPYTSLALAKKQAVADDATVEAATGRKTPRSGRQARTKRTIDTRRWQIQVSMTALVASGIPVEKITSLSMLATPLENPIAILDFHRERLLKSKLEKGEEFTENELRSANLKGIGELLRQIAKFEAGLSEGEMDELKEYIAMVTPNEPFGMSEKNRIRLTALFEDPAYSMLLALPKRWMDLANEPERDPYEAARMAMYAAALEILLFLPLRRMNLLQLKLDTNLRRPGPNTFINEVYIPAHKVKNHTTIRWPVEVASARVLETYIRKFRPFLAKPGNDHLFPGIGDSHRDDAEFGDQLSKRVAREIGVEFNCHLVRHFAVVRYLRKHPGAYEIAANILGHKSPQTTQKFYCGLELDAAARHSNALLFEERRITKPVAVGAYHQRHRVRRRKGDV